MSNKRLIPIQDDYLERGDYYRVAQALGVSKSAVSLVANGRSRNKRIVRAILALNEERRAQAKEEIGSLIEEVRAEVVKDVDINTIQQ